MAEEEMRRPLGENCTRWRTTLQHGASFSALQTAVTQNPQASPCVTGCRSVCWKTFLLFGNCSTGRDWLETLREARASYAERRNALLRYVKHPEDLAEAEADPLADDPDSPWNSHRIDEAMRAEIEQDVRRLPDEPFYHTDRIQTLILDVLFMWCKLHPRAGGYRQGMHELLAPIVLVLDQDSVLRAEVEDGDDMMMMEMLDADFVEHDAYALFKRLMQAAVEFYQLADPDAGGRVGGGAIVEKSRAIHEYFLKAVDPELAEHFTDIEVLPQIFLIRWIRLLFGREFPLDQLLIFWDVLFAVDPSLDIVDLICVAMLLRIRWDLIEADYAVALMLVLKYPVPDAPNYPHTFIEDALYLQSHMTVAGGNALMLKYSGRMPAMAMAMSSPQVTSPTMTRPNTPGFPSINFRPRPAARPQHRPSPLPSPSRYIQQQGGVEAMFQGAARNVLERGERLGINQAVRDAMGEIRRNVQTLSERSLPEREGGEVFEERSVLEGRRNRALGGVLDGVVARLGEVSPDMDVDRIVDVVGAAVERIRLVKACLEDPTVGVPNNPNNSNELKESKESNVSNEPNESNESSESDTLKNNETYADLGDTGEAASILVQSEPEAAARSLTLIVEGGGKAREPGLGLEPAPIITEGTISVVTEGTSAVIEEGTSPTEGTTPITTEGTAGDIPEDLNTSPPSATSTTPTQLTTITSPPAKLPSSPPASPPSSQPIPQNREPPTRPDPPVPTRSSLAQSSFAWMLEPDETSASAPPASAFPAVKRLHASAYPPGSLGQRQRGHRKKASLGRRGSAVGASRERNAFLFGEVEAVGSVGIEGVLVAEEEIFGLMTLGGGRREDGKGKNEDAKAKSIKDGDVKDAKSGDVKDGEPKSVEVKDGGVKDGDAKDVTDDGTDGISANTKTEDVGINVEDKSEDKSGHVLVDGSGGIGG